jgi:C-terminal processing protease CtpA/Prc
MVTDKDWVKKEMTDRYGYFRLLSFDKKVNGVNIENEFNSLVTELKQKNIPNLIIDLRYNSGGDPYMAGRMASLLVDQPFRVFEKLIVSQPQDPTYSQYMKINYKGRNKGVTKAGNHFEKISGDKGLSQVTPAKQPYTGKIYVITGPMTESTSTMLCKFLKNRKDVVFVGSETPGAINYFCAHKHCEIKLPTTGALVSFGLQLIELEKGSSDNQQPQGLKPDMPVEYTISEILLHKDKEMEWIRQEIQ